MKRFKIILALALLTLGGCGEEHETETSTPVFVYSGLTSAARISLDNGVEIASLAFKTIDLGETLGALMGNKIVSPTSGTFSSNCGADNGGSASYSFRAEGGFDNYVGSITFIGFCDQGVTLNGTIEASGRYDESVRKFETLTFTLHSLEILANAKYLQAEGTLEITPSFTPVSVAMEIKLRENDGTVYWANNFAISIIESKAIRSTAATGRLYFPDDGFVDISTPLQMSSNLAQRWPYSGEMKASGLSGSSVTIEAQSEEVYQYTIDTLSEQSSANELWELL